MNPLIRNFVLFVSGISSGEAIAKNGKRLAKDQRLELLLVKLVSGDSPENPDSLLSFGGLRFCVLGPC